MLVNMIESKRKKKMYKTKNKIILNWERWFYKNIIEFKNLLN